jgi:transcriptional regulator with XRE-family HTH domain
MPENEMQFAAWLDTTMKNRGLSQAELARAVGVADAQVSRWRRGQVVPTLRYLQQIANVIGVQRTKLDRLAGYPMAFQAEDEQSDPLQEAEIAEYEARFGDLLRTRLPREMWPAYTSACEALADGLAGSLQDVQEADERARKAGRKIGFGR